MFVARPLKGTLLPTQAGLNVGLLLTCLGFIIPLLLTCLGCMAKEPYTYSYTPGAYAAEKPNSPAHIQSPSKADFEVPSTPISVAEAIKIALRRNPDIDMAIARIQQSEAMIEEAMAAFWPTVSAYGEYLQGDAPSAYLFKTIDQGKLPPSVDFNDPGWFENYEIGLQGRINLFNGGRDVLRKRMAETGLKMYELDRQSIENSLIASVIHAYYNTLAAKDFIQIAQESVGSVETQLRVIEVRYQAGGVLKSDVLSLKVRLAQAREDLVRARNNHSLSLAALANLFGIDPDTPMILSGPEGVPLDMPEDYQQGLVYALASRAELKKVRQQIVQSRMDVDMARSEYLPHLDVQGKYYLDDPNLDFGTERENWTAGIILNWDLFTGLSTRARVNKAKSMVEEMLAADRKATLSVQLDLKTAYLKFAEAKARLAVTEASAAQAGESLRLVKKQYDGGSATITRYLDAELARNRARIRATAAFYDREKALASLGRALGYWGKYAKEALRGNE